MNTPSIAPQVKRRADVRKWAWWQLPVRLRMYVALVTLAALVAFVVAAVRTAWHADDAVNFVALTVGALLSVAATPRTAYAQGTFTRDFITAWVLPVAVLLPPVYAMVASVPLLVLTQWRINRGLIYRRVFTAAALGIGYGAASWMFHALPASTAGSLPGSGRHAVTWAAMVVASEVAGGWGHRLLIHLAIKIADPQTRIRDNVLIPEALVSDFAEHNLGVVITIVVALTPVFVIFAVPLWLLVRRFMVHTHLLTQARTDTKTGLLNLSAWENEATAELARAVRTRSPLSVALIDIDHFKRVNDTYGHLVGDTVLRAVTDAIRDHLRSYDLAGRFGGEEFVVLLPNAREADAVTIAERLRVKVADMAIPAVPGNPAAAEVRLTISVGVAALDDDRHELTTLIAAADAALYEAKQAGRNRTRVTPARVQSSRGRDPAAAAPSRPA